MQGIAAIKNVWGLHDEALEIYRANYNNLINIPDYQSTYYEDYIVLANNLSLSYIRNHIPDSALMVSEQAMKVTALSKDTLNYIDLVKVQATANYYLKNYPRAMDSLMRFLPEFTDLTLSDSYYMIGKMYQYYGNDQLVITYFKKIDSLHRIINDPYPELQEVYHTLFKHASSLNDMEQQGYYIDKLIEVDSILDHKYAKIGHKMRTGYDIPKLKKEKQQLNQKLNNKQTTIAITLITIGLLTLIMVYYYKRQRIYKKRLHNLLEQETTVTTRTKTDRKQKTDTLDLSPTIIEDVLKKIEQFEASKSYVSKDITLHTLAKEFNTNSTYLSNIVNHEKQSNFSTYLKDLRITNAINTIKSNKEYLKFSISGLADEFGFNTAESFSKAFWEKTGIKPSYFLDEMRRNIRGRDL
jgi:YesN/AraC family two-component response regulator